MVPWDYTIISRKYDMSFISSSTFFGLQFAIYDYQKFVSFNDKHINSSTTNDNKELSQKQFVREKQKDQAMRMKKRRHTSTEKLWESTMMMMIITYVLLWQTKLLNIESP